MPTHKHTDSTELGRRERQIMDVVHRHGRVTAAEIRDELPDPPSYSAVRGMLRLLEEKGYVRHEWDGPRYVYLPTADPERVRKSAVRHLLRTFFSNSMESAVAAMLGVAEQPPSDEELRRMAKLIDEARRGRKKK
ncbi:MAG: CopY family transcriptional regulator [Acidobacteria bacterium]|nr:MAG: CopY family transcriptional regulator [Acidobacteriota bacterium]